MHVDGADNKTLTSKPSLIFIRSVISARPDRTFLRAVGLIISKRRHRYAKSDQGKGVLILQTRILFIDSDSPDNRSSCYQS